MDYLRCLWNDVRRNVTAAPDLLLLAAIFALAALLPHYWRPGPADLGKAIAALPQAEPGKAVVAGGGAVPAAARGTSPRRS